MSNQELQLDSSSLVVPLYIQIKDILRSKIIDGTYQAHQKIPSESEMMKSFGVSRITVRQAINDLQKEGLLFKIHGKGSFVSKPKASQELTHLQGFGEAMHLLGHETHADVLHFGLIKASTAIAPKIGVKKEELITEIKRVRYLNYEPISVDYSYLKSDIGSQLSQKSLRNRDLFSLLENDLGLILESADLEIDATFTTNEIAKFLKMEVDSPILRIKRITYSSGKPLLFDCLHYPPETFKYRLKISR